MQNSLDRGQFVGSILIDCPPNGFKKESKRLVLSYVTNRAQRNKIGSTFRVWTNVLKGILQGFILGLLLFDIYLNDLFFFSAKCGICKFSDGNSIVKLI